MGRGADLSRHPTADAATRRVKMTRRARFLGGALDPSAVFGDPPKTRVSASFRDACVKWLPRAHMVFAAGRRKEHSGRVLHPDPGLTRVA